MAGEGPAAEVVVAEVAASSHLVTAKGTIVASLELG